MKSDFSNIIINGVPLKQIVSAMETIETKNQHRIEVGSLSKTIRAHIITSKVRNHSGSRSGRGRVIYSAALGGVQ